MPFVNVSNFNMHYHVAGRGRNLFVLLHGNFATWRWWQPVLKRISGRYRGYRAYAPDMRGCGDTDQPSDGYSISQHAEDLGRFMRRLNLRRVHLVGHSLGGCIALEFALAHPEYVKTLTLVSPAPAEGKTVLANAHINSAYSVARAVKWLALNGTSIRQMRSALFQMVPPRADGIDFETLVDDAVRMSNDAVIGHLQSLHEWDVRADLGGLRLPVLILGGQRDPLIPVAALSETGARLPNSRVIIWPNVGHTPQLERSSRFTSIVLKFAEHHTAIAPGKILKKLFRQWQRLFHNDIYNPGIWHDDS